jgi:hypothetical protein
MLSVLNKPFMLSVITKPFMLSVVILCVGMLNVVAPNKEPCTLKLFTAITETLHPCMFVTSTHFYLEVFPNGTGAYYSGAPNQSPLWAAACLVACLEILE